MPSLHTGGQDARSGVRLPDLAAVRELSCPANGAKPRRERVECGDLPFLIKRDGTWLYRGTPINRKEMVCLFSGVLKREADASFWLETPAERGRIEVEDSPWVAVEFGWTGRCPRPGADLPHQRGPDRHRRARPPDPHRARPADLRADALPARPRWRRQCAALEARIGRAVYYELVALAVPGMIRGRRGAGRVELWAFLLVGRPAHRRGVARLERGRACAPPPGGA